MHAHQPFSKTLAITGAQIRDKTTRVSVVRSHAALNVYLSFTLISHAAPPD